MIDEKMIADWHKAVRTAHKALGTDTASAAYQPYGPKNAGGRAADLRDLAAVEQRLVAHGFAALHLVDFKLMTTYGPIACRVWCEHQDKCLAVSVVARGATEKADNCEVAGYTVTNGVVEETHFDVAGLVLPKQG